MAPLNLKTVLTILLCLVLINFSQVQPQTTNFVNKLSKLEGYHAPQWYLKNIPFVEVPDKEIEDVYYYRWTSLKRHLRYTLPGAGFIVTEFVHKVGYSQKFDTINAAAGHHIDEAKWLRSQRYVKDYINVWSREGAGNQQYSEWIADSSYNAYLLNGDASFIKSQQQGLVTNFHGWSDRFEPQLNLYFITPHDDAMEHSASSEQTDDPYHGGLGYRPSFNSEMYANALAISKIARMNGDLETATEFETKAEEIRQGILDLLWDQERKFFYHVFREDNPLNELLDTREEIGFFPWRWNVPPKNDTDFESAWEHLFDPQGFDSAYGPTTCEQRSQWFDGNQTSQCCWWNGNSWPYSTGHTLRALASQVKNYRPTPFANVDSFHALLHKYAVTQHKNGVPYVAECHSPLYDFWVCDGRNHSEHYAHSTYNDNVLSDLIGIEPQADNIFQVNPLVPPSWTYFIAENIRYHGHDITVLYDRDGSKYQVGYGLQIYVNGQLVASQEEVGLMRVVIPDPVPDPEYPGFLDGRRLENYATNVNGFGYPRPSTSYSSATDSSTWQAVDGRVFYDFIPSNRWSNYGAPDIREKDWFAVDFGPGRLKNISQVKMFIYSDKETGGDVDCPVSMEVEYFSESTNQWTSAPNQVQSPATCVPNAALHIDFDPISTQQIRVQFANNISQNTYVGISELEIWAPWPQAGDDVYEAEDGLLSQDATILKSLTASGSSYVGGLVGQNSFLEFTGVWVESDRNYDVRIYYTNGDELERDATMMLGVNNIYEGQTLFPNTVRSGSGWGEFNPSTFVTVQVPLVRGNNVLVLKRDINRVEVDKIAILT